MPSVASSNLSTGNATTVSQYTPNKSERISYYNGITGDADHPKLVYHSDCLSTPFLEPVGRHPDMLVKSLCGVFNTPLNGIWDTVSPEICDLIKARRISWSSVDPARFYTHGLPEEKEKGSLSPVVSQEILTLLLENGVNDVIVEWHEAFL
ncbi:hypothetical protein H0H81_009384 [Sphagnurus paluster]|uniref:Uncharacterized protein n=1 Tax=Sphagnurus paluster TaxID=117069 RepID=A0A9P7GIG8_9AGAR|nr:hypothetical protein H0H81_009384 [Sphagnurus paluster]